MNPTQETIQAASKPPSCTAAFAGGVYVKPQPAQNNRNWSHVQPAQPVKTGYIQKPYNPNPHNQQSFDQSANHQQPYSQSTYQSEPSYDNVNQYQPQQVTQNSET